MTDPTTPDAQLDRVQQLQRRRAAAGSPAAPTGASAAPQAHRRIAPATGAKIATAGFFTATMFGMVGAMAISDHAMSAAANTTPATTNTSPTAPPTTAAPKVIVVVHHVDANGKPVAAPTVNGSSKATPAAAPAPVAITAPPIALTAAPVVQRVPAAAAAAPVARTSGSRH